MVDGRELGAREGITRGRDSLARPGGPSSAAAYRPLPPSARRRPSFIDPQGKVGENMIIKDLDLKRAAEDPARRDAAQQYAPLTPPGEPRAA